MFGKDKKLTSTPAGPTPERAQTSASSSATPKTSRVVEPGARERARAERVATAPKGRATPTRREAEAARRRPFIETDRKVAKTRDKSQQRNQRSEQSAVARRAMQTGDEKNLPPMHRGKERRFVRDVVDARRNAGEYFLLIALGVIVISFAAQYLLGDSARFASFILVPNLVLWAIILICLIDGVVLRKKLRDRLTAKYGGVPRGLVFYGLSRAFQVRRWRLPKPMVSRGDTVD